MKNMLVAAGIALLMPFSMFAQYTLQGVVYDRVEKIPLNGANVLVVGTFRGAVAGVEGQFAIPNITDQEIVVRVSFVGYETRDVNVNFPVDGSVSIALEPTLTMPDEFVVVGLRADPKTPTTFTNVSRQDIAPRNLGQDIPFLLNLTPSLVANSDAGAGVGYTSMKIRGSDDTRINVTLNGIPLNNPESHGVWWVNMPDIISSIESIQVQRGVGLSTHGAGAFGATISMNSSGFSQVAGAFLDNSAGSFGTVKNTLGFNTGLMNNKWAVDGRLSRVVSDGYIDRASSNLKSFFLSGGYFGTNTALRVVAFSGKEITYQAWNGVPGHMLETNRTYNPSGRFIDDQGNEQFYENETDNYEQHHFQMHLYRSFSNVLNANLSIHYTKGKGFYEQYRANERLSRYNIDPVEVGGVTYNRSDLVRRRWLDNHFLGAVYSWSFKPNSKLLMEGGGGYNTYFGLHFGEISWARNIPTINAGHRYYENDATKNDFNSFVKAKLDIAQRMQLFADLQFRHVKYSFEGPAWVLGEVAVLDHTVRYNFFNPKVGLTYNLLPHGTLYAFAGIGNREPIRRDFTESSPESRPRHETLQNLELGYRQSWKNIMVGANFYYMYYKDQLILTGQINDVGGFTRQNIEKSYRAGLEMELAVRFSDRLSWEVNATVSRSKIPLFVEYLDTYDSDFNWNGSQPREFKNTDIALSPKMVAASSLTYAIPFGLSFNLTSKYVGAQFFDNTMSQQRRLSPYLVNDFRVNFNFWPRLFKEVGLVLQVNNLFNVLYETSAWVYKGIVEDQGIVTIQDGFFPQAGRHIMVGLNLEF